MGAGRRAGNDAVAWASIALRWESARRHGQSESRTVSSILASGKWHPASQSPSTVCSQGAADVIGKRGTNRLRPSRVTPCSWLPFRRTMSCKQPPPPPIVAASLCATSPPCQPQSHSRSLLRHVASPPPINALAVCLSRSRRPCDLILGRPMPRTGPCNRVSLATKTRKRPGYERVVRAPATLRAVANRCPPFDGRCSLPQLRPFHTHARPGAADALVAIYPGKLASLSRLRPVGRVVACITP